ncbi:type VI secretion system protein TssA [Noviherbaspirillum sp.]|uniref:type VI secretion system protein TssA n=1 Tax=Noviherbaspirillum sp. TaxID=1926288 RepID=UPI002D4A5110|nr:type VI secretion system protein TssA [Noviherbaspirillum sp.]HZW19945.1 type VI secretion system protein TssA [Noviherbaspirillum sp.]
MIEIEQFCSVLDGDNPAGSDLEYDHAFLALDVAQRGRAERQFGETVIPAEPPDWKQVLVQATTLAARTRDLRVACALTRALTHLHGPAGLVQGLQIIERLCRTLWDHIYPQLDESEDNDPTLRMNALAPLSDRAGLLADIRDCVFVSARGMGGCTVRELEVALGILPPSSDSSTRPLALPEIDALVASAQSEGHFSENHAQRAVELTRALHAYLSGQVGVERAPDLQPLIDRLRPLAEYCRKFVSDEAPRESAGEPVPEPVQEQLSPAVARQAAGVQLSNEIRSSADAARMLDLICTYFEKHEPTNPAPLLLRRAQRLSTMSFYDIVRDIAPDAISAVDMVAGSREEA